MAKIKIINVVGARPNYMKIAPLIEEMKKHSEIEPLLVHTGQHYDENMSDLFFEDLGLPKPDIYLGVGSGSQAKQTAKTMVEFESILVRMRLDLTIVVGDVNSTVACALTSVKLGIPVAHVEAGLRSFDRAMPEEINRVLTDSISDFLFITEKDAEINLLREGRPNEKIFFVGNTMIDSLLKNKNKANESRILEKLKLKSGNFALLTLHRPSNVDNKETFMKILEALVEVKKHIKIVYPVHPRAERRIKGFGFLKKYNFLANSSKIISKNSFLTCEPLGYLDFLKLMSEAKLVLTDSGGIQEETTVLGIPCLTLRENTERPVTISEGTNKICGTNVHNIVRETLKILNNPSKIRSKIPRKWDGLAARRIIKILINRLK